MQVILGMAVFKDGMAVLMQVILETAVFKDGMAV